MNKKIKKMAAALSLCVAMAAAMAASLNLVSAQAAKKLTMNAKTVEIERGGKYQLLLDADEPETKAEWTSSNERVAKVTQAGRIESLATGTTTITAKLGKLTGTCTVKVVPTGSVAKEFYGTWESEYYENGIRFSAGDMTTPLKNLLKDISKRGEFKGFTFVRVASYAKVDGRATMHVQARKDELRLSAFLSIENGKDRDYLNVLYTSGANPTEYDGGESLFGAYGIRIK